MRETRLTLPEVGMIGATRGLLARGLRCCWRTVFRKRGGKRWDGHCFRSVR